MPDTITKAVLPGSDKPPLPGGDFHAEPEQGRQRSLFLFSLAIATGVFLLALLVFGVYGVYGYDRIYGGVTVQGADLGGLTRSEAADKLASVLTENQEYPALDIYINDTVATLNAEALGAELSADAAAENAWNQGREGGFFARLGFVYRSLFVRTDINAAGEYYIDRDVAKQAVAAFCLSINGNVTSYIAEAYTWEQEEDVLVIRGGKDTYLVDSEALTAAVLRAFDTGDYSPVTAEVTVIPAQPCPIEDIHAAVTKERQNARYDKESGGIIPHEEGVSFNLKEAQLAIAKGFEGELRIPLAFTQPEVTAEYLRDNLFTDLLGETSTSASGSNANRINNITLAAGYFDNTILNAGEEFSFNKIVGRRTADRGFLTAGSYLNGTTVDVVGGGICQASTTLYMATLAANLKIVDRRGHSMTVSYASPGHDATVDWDNIDFVFANDTGFPIRINAWFENKRIHVQIWGTKTDDLTVSIESETLSTTPPETVEKLNPELAPGTKNVVQKGSTGIKVQTYRVLTDSQGSVVSREKEALSTYRKADKIIEVGPEAKPGVSVTPEVTPAPTPEVTPVPEESPAPTPEATPAPTPEATPVPTPDVPQPEAGDGAEEVGE